MDWICVLSHHISMDTPTEVALATGLAVVALAVVLGWGLTSSLFSYLRGVLLMLGAYFTFIVATPTSSRTVGEAPGPRPLTLLGAGFVYYCSFVLWDPGGGGVLQLFHVCILWLELIPSNKRNWVDCGGIAVHIVVHGVGVGGVGHCQASHTLHRTS